MQQGDLVHQPWLCLAFERRWSGGRPTLLSRNAAARHTLAVLSVTSSLEACKVASSLLHQHTRRKRPSSTHCHWRYAGGPCTYWRIGTSPHLLLTRLRLGRPCPDSSCAASPISALPMSSTRQIRSYSLHCSSHAFCSCSAHSPASASASASVSVQLEGV